MQASEIQALIASHMNAAQVEVAGEGGKYMVRIVAPDFAGLNAVKRQQAVYRLLNEHISSGAIHAVSMDLKTPEEA